MNQPASNVTLKHPTGPWWTIYGTAGEIVQQIAQVFPHLSGGPTDFPVIVAQASSEWAALVSATSGTPAQAPAATQAPRYGVNPEYTGKPAPVVTAPEAPGGAPQCVHGPMKWVTSKPGAEKTWQGWFCSGPQELPRDQKCPTQWKRS